jgi:hypothetical protein
VGRSFNALLSIALVAGFCLAGRCGFAADPAALTLHVLLVEMDAKFWRDACDDGKKDGTTMQASVMDLIAKKAATLHAAAECKIPRGEKAAWSHGNETDFPTEWQVRGEASPEIAQSEKRFHGTKLEAIWTDDPLSLTLKIAWKQPLPEPDLLNYDVKATGPERAKLSLPLPSVRAIEWQGTLLLQPSQWTSAASFAMPDPDKGIALTRRFLVLVKADPE